MPTAAKLKVFRTPIGFHDAYIAAPSRKAALAAWGTDKDLFARGAAEVVTDPALTAAPLATPGVVVKLSRGTMAEQVAALPPDKPRARKPAPEEKASLSKRAKPAKPAPKPVPRPSRAALNAAEQAEQSLRDRHAEALDALAERERALARERRALEKTQASALERAARERTKAAANYEQAMRMWRGL